MNTSEIKKIVFACNNGSPELRLSRAAESKLKLNQELTRLQDKAVRQREEFKQRLEAWTSTHVNSTPRPLTIEQDLRDARLVNSIAWALTITELFLTFFIATVFGIPPVFLLLLAAVAVFALKAGLLVIWRNEMQPQETKCRLRNFIIMPSLIVTMLSATTLIFARGLGGALALLLLPFFNLALCALSLGCLFLAAGLFALGYLFSWSKYAERQYDAVEFEAIETLRVLQQVEKIEEELKAKRLEISASTAQVSPNGLQAKTSQADSLLLEQSKSIAGDARKFLPLILLLVLHSAGCSTTCINPPDLLTKGMSAPAAATPESASAAEIHEPASEAAKIEQTAVMEIFLDWSLSTDAAAYRQAVKSLIAAMPEIASRHRVVRLTVYQFGSNGWNAEELLSLDLPLQQQVEDSEAAALFGQMRKEQERQSQQQYNEQLHAKLDSVTEAKLLPDQVSEPKCTDLQGVFMRIAGNRRSQQRLVFLLTDGLDTCSRQLKPVSLSSSNAEVVVILLPEQSRNEGRTLSSQTWKQTQAQITQALPDAAVIPHFADPAAAVSEAAARSSQPKTQPKK